MRDFSENMKEFLNKYNHSKLSLYSIIALFMGTIFGPFIFPRILETGMKMQLRITPSTQTRPLFENVPFPLEYKLYLFNVTNKDEITAGGKPKLEEIGPYHFDEWIKKVEIEDNKAEDTIEYDYIRTYHFRPDKSAYNGEETVIVPHPLILSLIFAVNVERKSLLDFIYTAMTHILHDPQHMFFIGRPIDLFINGILLDCSSDSFEVSGVCAEFDTGDYKEIKRFNETAFTFSLVGNSNGTSAGRFTALRGKKNIEDVGRVIRFNGLDSLESFIGDDCNEIKGTDGTIFPPFHTSSQPYYVFAPQICRSLRAVYDRPSKYKGIKTNRFLVDFDVSNSDFDASCYCREDGYCAPKGIYDLFNCLGVPFGLSAPHFLNADPSLLEKIDGLHPNPEKHEFFMDFYQFSGTPVSAFGRIQLNMEVMPIDEIPFMRNLSSMYLPILWIEDGVSLGKKFTNMLKYQLILMRKFQKFITYAFSLLGIALAVIALMSYSNVANTPQQQSRVSDYA